jgi:glycosyltransferase involved in cell wall biosynthesis
MREHDAVLVPSRHAYPEGLPMTIYEALCARTPLLVSDHPMFAGKVVHETSALVFRASDPLSLAQQATRLSRDAELYKRLSCESAAAWQALQCPVTWGELLTRWLRNTENDHRWFVEHSLASAHR